jgi:Holliday junction DNA helicase RuvB
LVPHCLFFGPPGLGKTTVARIISNEIKAAFVELPNSVKPSDVTDLLATLYGYTIIFIDEIHQLSLKSQEAFYIPMEDYKLIEASSEVIAFTLIGSTTEPHRLAKPFRNRFGFTYRFEYYPKKDIADIVKSVADKAGWQLTEGVPMLIAKLSRGTPREAIRLLTRTREYSVATNKFIIDKQTVLQTLNLLGIDEEGLHELDRLYLNILKDVFDGGPAGIKAIADILGESPEILSQQVEPYLLYEGYIVRTKRGRKLAHRSLLQS